MFDSLIFHDMIDMGQDIPPILPHIVYQTKDLDRCLRMFHVRGNRISVDGVMSMGQSQNCDDVLNLTSLHFYLGASGLDEGSILETSLAKATDEEILKALFFTDLFSRGWLEYDVDLSRGEITRINRVYGGVNCDVEWIREGYWRNDS